MSIKGDIGWQHNTISYDAILEKVRATNGSNASLQDLSMFNQLSAEDPLEALIRMEDSDEWNDEVIPDPTLFHKRNQTPTLIKKVEMKMNAQMKEALKDVEIATERSIVVTPALEDMLDEMTQFAFNRMITGGYWVAALLHESVDGKPDDFKPDVDDTEGGIAQAIQGIEQFAYNRDVQDTDPERKGMSTGQWEFLTNMAKQATENVARLDTLQGAGFVVHDTFESKYNEIRDEIAEKARIKQQAANMREARRKDAANRAGKEVKAKLASITGR